MENTFLIITSIANDKNEVLKVFAKEAASKNINFVIIGDTKSPDNFHLDGCDFYSIKQQESLDFHLSKIIPVKHYSRKNIGYLIAMSKGSNIIIETDDDNFPTELFWEKRTKKIQAHILKNKGWVNVYKYFTDSHIWPRGFSLENIQDEIPILENQVLIECPIQQGLADENPDVDAIYRLTMPLPITFKQSNNIALGTNSICPFNSQNTTWFKESFPLLYLPSYCSFRMTDIWRSFVAQRIAWTCNWPILFHKSTVWQERNDHNLIVDFKDEISGYLNNYAIMNKLIELDLDSGVEYISNNMRKCYQLLIESGYVGMNELELLESWLYDVKSLT